MLSQYTKIILVNKTLQGNVYDNAGRVSLIITGIYVVPSTGLLAYDDFSADDFSFGAGETIANDGEVESSVIDNTSNKYINAFIQINVIHSAGATAVGSWDLYLDSSNLTNTMQSDSAFYTDAETNKLPFIGSLVWPSGGSDDDLFYSSRFLI